MGTFVGGTVKLTFAGIACFCAGFFLTYGLSKHDGGRALAPNLSRGPAAAEPLHAQPHSLHDLAANELRAPQFTNPSELKFTRKSGIFVRWSEVPGADIYKITISDPNGVKLREYKTKRTFTLLKTLGAQSGQTQFTIQVAAVDSNQVEGPPSEAKKLLLELIAESPESENTPPAPQSKPQALKKLTVTPEPED